MGRHPAFLCWECRGERKDTPATLRLRVTELVDVELASLTT